ncbi:outer membrane beta-barrel protein [Parabacteroides chinchillae]|uniref:Outer membrane protein beta-barrel domain-containing protein n=1 Tax=Parabacteroides chinchillae TaxID=871327 RepID=A0A8G2F501_9BACT|nr:outer membrane beta-barrel protein [Parabacteroides chinchillae]SEF85237.1 Outer membrane protein beta-barrel domain-containing protein [Parabacteroides chinchillae]
MNKIYYLFVAISVMAFTATAQESGSYISVTGNVGSSSLNYKLKGIDGNRDSKVGYGMNLEYSYFFDEHWGIASGLGFTHFKTMVYTNGTISKDDYSSLGMQIDNDDISGNPKDYELRARLANWDEKQYGYFLDIPVMGKYQTWFGETQRWGMYAGLGVKLQFPIRAKYSFLDNKETKLNVSGYYAHIPEDVGAPGLQPVPQHGFGTTETPENVLNGKGNAKLQMSVTGSLELGFMVDLGQNMDLLLGGYFDYGFNDLKKKKSKSLLTAPENYHPDADNNVGKGISYDGLLNTHFTNKVNLVSFGAKIGLRFKL